MPSSRATAHRQKPSAATTFRAQQIFSFNGFRRSTTHQKNNCLSDKPGSFSVDDENGATRRKGTDRNGARFARRNSRFSPKATEEGHDRGEGQQLTHIP